MAKYYGYEKGLPRRGFVRKALDDVVAIEEAWVSELDAHFMREGYDELLSFVALTLKNKMNINVSRAQAWVLLNLVTENGVPEALRQEGVDEEINKGSLAKDLAKAPFRAAATVVDVAANTVSDVAKSTASAASSAASAVKSVVSTSEESEEESEESPSE
tara:strand:- start:10263 stop:10742 length:480 start_codon:yes stop_codon:yes gene_type:complete